MAKSSIYAQNLGRGGRLSYYVKLFRVTFACVNIVFNSSQNNNLERHRESAIARQTLNSTTVNNTVYRNN